MISFSLRFLLPVLLQCCFFLNFSYCQSTIKSKELNPDINTAIEEGSLSKLDNLITKDPDQVYAKDKDGRTALRLACEKNNVELATYLIKKRANVNSKDYGGTSILFFSCIRYNHDAAKVLVRNGADVNIKTEGLHTPLHALFNPWGTDIELLKMLIEKGADINANNERNESPLDWAIQYLDTRNEAVRMLLDNGANVNHTDGKKTLLHLAVFSDSPEQTKILLDNKVKVNQKTLLEGYTELHLAAISGNVQITKLLIEHGARVDALNNELKSPLYYASKHGHKQVSDILIQNGADKDQILEENYGHSKYLDKSLNDKQFYCWSIEDDGWAIKTKDHLLLFDPGNMLDITMKGLLANGHINPDELRNQNILVFCTKPDRDYYNPAILKLGKLHNNVKFYYGFDPVTYQGHKDYDLTQVNYKQLIPDQIFEGDMMEIKPFAATQSGIGFVLKIDGLTLFYNGWHVSNDDNQLAQYRTTIDQLEPKFRDIDCAFLPVVSHAVHVEALVGYYYLMEHCDMKNILLTHGNWFRSSFLQYLIFNKQLKEFKPDSQIGFPENYGDRFFIDANNSNL